MVTSCSFICSIAHRFAEFAVKKKTKHEVFVLFPQFSTFFSCKTRNRCSTLHNLQVGWRRTKRLGNELATSDWWKPLDVTRRGRFNIVESVVDVKISSPWTRQGKTHYEESSRSRTCSCVVAGRSRAWKKGGSRQQESFAGLKNEKD